MLKTIIVGKFFSCMIVWAFRQKSVLLLKRRYFKFHYPMMTVDKFCVMPEHIHRILSINAAEDGRQDLPPLH